MNLTKFLLNFSIKFLVNSCKFASLCVGYVCRCVVDRVKQCSFRPCSSGLLSGTSKCSEERLTSVAKWTPLVTDITTVSSSVSALTASKLSIFLCLWSCGYWHDASANKSCTTRAARYVNSGGMNLQVLEVEGEVYFRGSVEFGSNGIWQ